MSGNRKKRDAPISYRPPEKLRDEFHARAQNSGLSVNAFITAAIFGQQAPRARRESPLDQRMAVLLLSQAARIADRLDEQERKPFDAGCQAVIAECRDELTSIRTCLMIATGREP